MGFQGSTVDQATGRGTRSQALQERGGHLRQLQTMREAALGKRCTDSWTAKLSPFLLGPGPPSPGLTVTVTGGSTGASGLLTASPRCAPRGMTVMEGRLVL